MPTDEELQVSEQQKRMKNAGTKSKETAELMLEELVNDKNFNISYKKGYALGYTDKEEQFKMDYCVTFHDFDDKEWLVKVTSSFRSDRIYGPEFFAQNIRIIDSSADAKNIDKIYAVLPDSISDDERANAKRYSERIKSSTYISFISDIITINELRERIISKCMSETPQGVRSNIIGKDSEKRVTNLLNNKRNWRLWNDYQHNKHKDKTDTFPWFKAILSGIGAECSIGYNESQDPIERIKATDDIPKLEGGGSPKTDVSFLLSTKHKKDVEYNISIKRTENKLVTVHEGNVSDIIKALKIPDGHLAKALFAFQEHGSKKQLKASGNAAYIDVLDNELPKYNKALVEFAFFGVNSPRVTTPVQIADCIIYFDSNPSKDSFWLRDDFVEHYLETYKERVYFGTPFQWTYPSGKLGESIQLKGYTNN